MLLNAEKMTGLLTQHIRVIEKQKQLRLRIAQILEHNKRDLKVIIISPKQTVIFKKQNSPTLCLMFIMPRTH